MSTPLERWLSYFMNEVEVKNIKTKLKYKILKEEIEFYIP